MKKKHDKRYTFLSTRERIELEKTKDILGEDYVKMVLSDMSEKELYPGWANSVCDRSDSIEMDWDGRYNLDDEII